MKDEVAAVEMKTKIDGLKVDLVEKRLLRKAVN